jgi:4-alpha-glucanotransferase
VAGVKGAGPTPHALRTRCGGILLHPTSLPGDGGIGTIGADARRFADLLAGAGQKLWQVLPLGPTGYGDSPYQCFSAFAGNPLLVSLDGLRDEGLLDAGDLARAAALPRDAVDFAALIPLKVEALRKACDRAGADAGRRDEFDRFCLEQCGWLDDFALFMSLKEAFGGGPWFKWPEPLRRREPDALRLAADRFAGDIARWKRIQFFFFSQWRALKAHASAAGVRIVGDLPLYVAHDSCDVWSHPEQFRMSASLDPELVAGVPPDYFSRTGQLWGNPVYDWPRHEASGFAWWIERVKANLALCDVLRIDHFRGLAAFWAVPYGRPTAEQGEWLPAAGAGLLSELRERLGALPLIAEDLGLITPDVADLRARFGLPGMRVLQFAFDSGPGSPHLPHHHPPDCVVYTGTHDNDTVRGWYRSARSGQRACARRYFGASGPRMHWAFVRAAWASVAIAAVAPLQDVMGLGSEGRMNVPATTRRNWRWRFRWDQLADDDLATLRGLTDEYSR